MDSKQLLFKVMSIDAEPLAESFLRTFAETAPEAKVILNDIEKNAYDYCQILSLSPDRIVWITNRIKEFL